MSGGPIERVEGEVRYHTGTRSRSSTAIPAQTARGSATSDVGALKAAAVVGGLRKEEVDHLRERGFNTRSAAVERPIAAMPGVGIRMRAGDRADPGHRHGQPARGLMNQTDLMPYMGEVFDHRQPAEHSSIR